MSENRPCSSGTHLLSPDRVVGLLQSFDAARAFLTCLSLADIRLLPGVPGGHATVAWEAPGEPVPRVLEVARNRVAWLEEVPEYLGRIDAIMHVSPVGAHRDGDLAVSHPNGASALFPHSGVADDVPMTIAVIAETGGSGDAGSIQVTDRGVWHTLLPQRMPLVPMGANLGTYLTTLVPTGELLPYQWCVRALRNYWIGVVFVLDQRAAVYCPCGRDTMRHYPSWESARPIRP
ncbi:hypothetical protein [Embleya sp. NPDC050493]|uniref:hypothetical protein n=1 Tax=Embleya sp. NPDC050493 TaxID=3363989 RepID=UPI003799FE1B